MLTTMREHGCYPCNMLTPRSQTIYRHYLEAWMEKVVPPVIAADIARATGIEKSQISRWLSHPERKIGNRGLRLLGEFFGVEPRAILQHPDRYRIDELLANQPDTELERARTLLEAGGFSTR